MVKVSINCTNYPIQDVVLLPSVPLNNPVGFQDGVYVNLSSERDNSLFKTRTFFPPLPKGWRIIAGCRPLRHTVVFPNPHPALTRAKHLSLSELKPYNMAKDWATVNALVTTTPLSGYRNKGTRVYKIMLTFGKHLLSVYKANGSHIRGQRALCEYRSASRGKALSGVFVHLRKTVRSLCFHNI